MNIRMQKEEQTLTISMEGRLDAIAAPDLEDVFRHNLNGVEMLVLDFEKIEYISSAGLRAILSAQKVMNTQGEMILCNVNEVIMAVLEVTGFADIMQIEPLQEEQEEEEDANAEQEDDSPIAKLLRL